MTAASVASAEDAGGAGRLVAPGAGTTGSVAVWPPHATSPHTMKAHASLRNKLIELRF
jgi:hypothetical protein